MARSKKINRHVETIHATEMGFLGANEGIVRFGFGPVGSRMFREFPRSRVNLDAYRRAIVEAPKDFDASCEEAVCNSFAGLV